MRILCTLFLVALATLAASPLASQEAASVAATAIVTGTVKSAVNSAPVRIAVVRLAGSSVSALTDNAGRFRLELPLGDRRLEVRRIGYRPATVPVSVVPAGAAVEVLLDPIAVGLERVVVTARDDEARRIIAAAVRRKQESRGRVRDYRYDGDVRLVVRKLNKPADSASSVVVITQSRTAAYWEQPSQYQETIVARRQTGNLTAEQNLAGVGGIVNFSRDRVQLGQFELPSPVADDALERYEYRVLDTLAIDGRRVFRLSLEPVPDGTPAFAGIIDIADSTFDVTGIDVGVNNAVRLGILRNVHYQQRLADMGGGQWMPRSIELSVDVVLPIGGSNFRIEQLALLSGFAFNEGRRPAGLSEYRLVVSDSADRADSTVWTSARAVPLTAVEQRAWTRIDSIANNPGLRRRLGRAGTAAVALVGDENVFRFNRVDGAYVGAGKTWHNPAAMPGTEPTLKIGYSEASDRWHYEVGERIRLSDAQRLWIGASYHDRTMSRPTLTSPGYNPAFVNLFSTIDPLDYFRERGFKGSVSMKLVDFVRLDAGYSDLRQSSLPLVVTKPPFGSTRKRSMRTNDAIDDGRLRALSAGVTYDSRSLFRQNGVDVRLGALHWTRLSVNAELSPGDALGSDFDYRRYSVRFDRRQQTFGMGVTSLLATGGIGTSKLPSQRFFGVDGGAQVLEVQASPFLTMVDSSFSAPRAAVLAIEHDFDRLLFTKSGLPLIRSIPFTFAIRGSMFWTQPNEISAGRLTVRAPYQEVGFSVGNITPFAAPFNLAVRFAWQISDYPTSPFRVGIGFAP